MHLFNLNAQSMTLATFISLSLQFDLLHECGGLLVQTQTHSPTNSHKCRDWVHASPSHLDGACISLSTLPFWACTLLVTSFVSLSIHMPRFLHPQKPWEMAAAPCASWLQHSCCLIVLLPFVAAILVGDGCMAAIPTNGCSRTRTGWVMCPSFSRKVGQLGQQKLRTKSEPLGVINCRTESWFQTFKFEP